VAVADNEAVTEPEAETLAVDVGEGDAVCNADLTGKKREKRINCHACRSVRMRASSPITPGEIPITQTQLS
jgi:hypothetical protein